MISRYGISGGGGAGGVINDASGGDGGIVSKLTSPVVLAVAGIAGYFVFMD